MIINVTPTPSCNPLYPEWAKELQGLTDNKLEAYSYRNFVDGMHLNRTGALQYSAEVGQQILRLERSEGPEPPSTRNVMSSSLR